jgi:hypothetical protein
MNSTPLRVAAARGLVLDPLRVRGHLRRHVGVQHGRQHLRVLADLRRDQMRQRDRQVRVKLRHQLGDRSLVRRVHDRPHQADGDRLDPGADQPVDRGADLGDVQRRHDLAAGVDPLGDLDHVADGQERLRRQRLREVQELVDVESDPAAGVVHDPQRVAEAARRQQPDA